MGKKVSQLVSLSNYNGTPQTPVSVLSSSTVLTANTISFSSTDNSINDSSNQLISTGFALNMAVNVEGSESNDFYSGLITSLSSSKAILSGVTLVNESVGNIITLNAWESHRMDVSNVAITGSYNDLLDTPSIPSSTTEINDSTNKRYITDTEKAALDIIMAGWIDMEANTTLSVSGFGSQKLTKTLTANTTFTNNLVDNDDLVLALTGAGNEATFTDIVWKTDGNTAPVLNASGPTFLIFSMLGSTIYGWKGEP